MRTSDPTTALTTNRTTSCVRSSGAVLLTASVLPTEGPSASYREVAVDDQQLVSGNVKLAAQLVRLPVEDPEALVVRVEDGLQKLQLGLQSRHRHLPLLISERERRTKEEELRTVSVDVRQKHSS